ncbi:uncharacterized protein LOC126336989 [Schistocerca gregaria]|uniref:uncharacterized protein LOC126336989 n=1 Tax=Schistocerca gregaria TaxID=7010 RepID=UPI00211E720A|nr:uncharacterized protein LOC126336989 [Schistocerca gregaria]
MDHLLHDSSSEHRSAMENKASKKIKVPATAKKSDTVFADGKSTKDGYECRLRQRSNSSTSLSSIFSSSGVKCVEKVIETGGIQELIGSGNEMQLQEVSFQYVPCRPGTAPLNRKHLFTAAHHGDNTFDKSPSKLRLHLKAPVDVSQLLKKVPTGSYITIDSPGANVPEREVTVAMVLVDNLRSEDGRGTNCSSAQEIPSAMASHTNREQAEDTQIGDSQDLSILAPEDCGADEHTSANQLQSDVDNVDTHRMETSEVTTTDLSTTKPHSPHKDRCCNGECWICQLSTIKVIQYTQGLDSCGDLPNPENSENVVDTPNSVKSAVNEDEITASANVPTNVVQGVSSVVSRTPGTAQYSGSNERLPLPEPTPIGDVPLQEYHIEDIVLPSTQNEVTALESRESWSTNPTLYRTTMVLRLYPDGNRLSGNNSSSSSGGERMNESSGTSKEVVSEEQKPPQMADYDANSSHCEETNKTAPLPTVDDESKGDEGDDVGKMSTEIIDIFRKYKRRSQRRNKSSMEGIHETRIMDGLTSYTGCATESDVSLIPGEEEGVPESANTQSFASGEDILTSENQGTKCTETSEEGGRNFLSCEDGKSTLKRFSLEYDILSKVMLYATLRQLEMNSTSVARTAGVQPCAQNKICGGSGPNYMGDAFQPSLDMEVVRSLMQLQNSQHKYTSTKSTWTGPEEINTSPTEHSASSQALPITFEEESSRETGDTKERQQSVPDADGGTIEANVSNTQLLTVTSKTEKNCSMLCTKGSVARDDRTPNVVEEVTCNDMEGESVADSQDMRDLEAIDFSSSSVSSNATKSQRSNNAETHKTASVEGSVKEQKLCSVEVRNKVHHPGGEPQQRNRPKRPQTRDRILSAREVYERRKTYAKNLALRRTQRTKFCGGSEDGEIRSTLDENQSASEEKSTGESSHKEYPSRNKKSADGYQSADSVKRIEAGNESVSSNKETTVKNFKHTTDKPRAGTRPEAVRAGKGESSCSTSSTKNKSAASSVKDRTVYGNRGLRSDSKLPGARERSVRTNVIGQQRRGPVKEVDKESANIGRSSASSDHSGGASGAKRTPGSIAANAGNGRKLFGIHGHGLKSTTVNDSAVRAPTPSKQRGLTEKQSNKHLDSKSSLLKSVEFDCLEIIDKPSLCESWVKQHYSDSTLGSICGSSSAETTVKTTIHSTNKSGTELKVSRNPAVSCEKTITANESRERLNRKARGGSEGKASTPPNQQTSLPSEKRKVSRQTDEEKILPSGDSERLMISFRTDTIPLLTYKPQKLSSDDLKSAHSAHSRESRSEKRSQLLLDSLHTQTAGLPSSQTDVGDVRKIAELLGSKLDEDTRSNLHLPEMNYSTENVTETLELRKTLSYGNKTTATQSSPPSVPDRKSVATSPMPLRKHSRQMSLTVEAFSFCSTGVNTSLSVSRLSSHSLGVQCPSQAISKRPSATTGLLQSIIEAEVKPETHVYAATGMHAMLTEVATKLESQLLVQRSVATQWMRRASVPNLALKSPGPKVKKTGKRKKRDSSNKGQGATSPQPQLVEYDLGLNEVQMENVRALHKRRLFRAFSTNSLALGTNEESTKKVMRRLFRKKKKKKQKSDSTEGKSKGDKKKKKKKQEEEQSQDSATVSGSGGAHSPTAAEVAIGGDDNVEATTDRSNKSSRSHFDNLSDATGGLRTNLQHKLKEAVQKAVSPRMLLLRGAETAQNPALFEDLEGGSNWCSEHNRAPEQGGAEADADEVSAAVAQVNTGAHVLRVSLADEESTGCSDLGSMEFVVGGADAGRHPVPTPSVLARLRQMLTWRS